MNQDYNHYIVGANLFAHRKFHQATNCPNEFEPTWFTSQLQRV